MSSMYEKTTEQRLVCPPLARIVLGGLVALCAFRDAVGAIGTDRGTVQGGGSTGGAGRTPR